MTQNDEDIRDACLLEAATHVAVVAHAEQQRKNSCAAKYVTHPLGVAAVLQRALVRDPIALAAAMLHDVIEDTSHTRDMVATVMTDRFGCAPADVSSVLDAVCELSEKKLGADGKKLPWRVRKEEHLSRLKLASKRAIDVKVADTFHNLLTLLADVKRSSPSAALAAFNAPPEELEWYWREIAELGVSSGSSAAVSVGHRLLAVIAEISALRRA